MAPIRNLLAVTTAASLALASAALLTVSAPPAGAQEVVENEGSAYRAWYEANQAKDIPKATQAAKDYLAKYPTGQYAAAIKTWLGAQPNPQMAALDAAVKEKRIPDMIAAGQQVLATEPENLNVLYAMAFQIRANELLAGNYQHAAEAADYAKRAIGLIESGKTLTGVANFDKNGTLAWLTQMLALVAQKNGNSQEAMQLFEKSTSLAPQDPAIAARNLLATLVMRQASYAEAAKAYNAIPEADRAAADAKPDVKAARDKINAEADAFIDVAARFVALARKNTQIPAATRDKVNASLESVYKVRFPEDTSMGGLQKILQEKEAAVGAPAAAVPPGD